MRLCSSCYQTRTNPRRNYVGALGQWGGKGCRRKVCDAGCRVGFVWGAKYLLGSVRPAKNPQVLRRFPMDGAMGRHALGVAMGVMLPLSLIITTRTLG